MKVYGSLTKMGRSASYQEHAKALDVSELRIAFVAEELLFAAHTSCKRPDASVICWFSAQTPSMCALDQVFRLVTQARCQNITSYTV